MAIHVVTVRDYLIAIVVTRDEKRTLSQHQGIRHPAMTLSNTMESCHIMGSIATGDIDGKSNQNGQKSDSLQLHRPVPVPSNHRGRPQRTEATSKALNAREQPHAPSTSSQEQPQEPSTHKSSLTRPQPPHREGPQEP